MPHSWEGLVRRVHCLFRREWSNGSLGFGFKGFGVVSPFPPPKTVAAPIFLSYGSPRSYIQTPRPPNIKYSHSGMPSNIGNIEHEGEY